MGVGFARSRCRTSAVKVYGRGRRIQEVDFVVNRGTQRYYIQSALTVAAPEKRKQETESLKLIPDFFKKIVVVREDIVPWHDEDGILYVGVEQFLLDETAIDQ